MLVYLWSIVFFLTLICQFINNCTHQNNILSALKYVYSRLPTLGVFGVVRMHYGMKFVRIMLRLIN